jgi:glutaconyl-CoA/methylmalonyl-CoA decarboxylase subunit gamma
MEKKFRITIEGKQYIVAVEDLSIEDVQTLYPSPGSMHVTTTSVVHPTAAATPIAAVPGDEIAPLGGVVQEIHVSVGQEVNEGDKLISLEAMKMVTPVFAKHGGRITNIVVKTGDPVDAGQVLLTIG